MGEIDRTLETQLTSLEIFDSFEKDAAGQTIFYGIVGLPTNYVYNGKPFKQLESQLNDPKILDSLIGRPVLVEHEEPDNYENVRKRQIGTVLSWEIVSHKGFNVPKAKFVSIPGVDIEALYKEGYKYGSPGYKGLRVYDSSMEGAVGYIKREEYFQYSLTKAPRGGKDVEILFDSVEEKEGGSLNEEQLKAFFDSFSESFNAKFTEKFAEEFNKKFAESVKPVFDSVKEKEIVSPTEKEYKEYYNLRTAKVALASELKINITDSMDMKDIDAALLEKCKTFGLPDNVFDSLTSDGVRFLAFFAKNANKNNSVEENSNENVNPVKPPKPAATSSKKINFIT